VVVVSSRERRQETKDAPPEIIAATLRNCVRSSDCEKVVLTGSILGIPRVEPDDLLE
jgi:hypothetical protein